MSSASMMKNMTKEMAEAMRKSKNFVRLIIMSLFIEGGFVSRRINHTPTTQAKKLAPSGLVRGTCVALAPLI
uniref:Uncharacterized protein n=1 Tax=Arundo donax TaxID=35708 RepID=A0A0A9GSU8_ARUDO